MKQILQYLCLFVAIIYSKEQNEKQTIAKYEIKYFDTYLDHFSYRHYNATFKLRYLFSISKWQPGNAILFFCGNEDSIEASSRRSGFVWQLSEQLSAMVVFAEHRYYGESRPFGHRSFTTPDLFGYLSSEQALADYASLIVHLKSSVEGADRSAVIAIGGSYGGMLAAWLRQKYPNIVAGSLASSAPILMVNNITHCNYPNRILTESFRTKGSPACVDNIRRLWPLLRNIKSVDGLRSLSATYNICQPIETVAELITHISNTLFSIGVANFPYAYTLQVPMPAWPVTAFCRPLSVKIVDPQELFRAVSSGIHTCYNHTHQRKCISLQSTNTLDDTGWLLQTCTELPIPMCTDGITDMFYGDAYNATDIDRQCEVMFQVTPRRGWAQTHFWGNELRTASNIIFSNGLLDPWAAGGIYSSVGDSIHIIRIPNGAHHIDLSSSHRNDPPDVRRARTKEKIIIRRWINEWNQNHGP